MACTKNSWAFVSDASATSIACRADMKARGWS